MNILSRMSFILFSIKAGKFAKNNLQAGRTTA